MGQHSKYTFEMKLTAVTKYLEGRTPLESLARSLGDKWGGAVGLIDKREKKTRE